MERLKRRSDFRAAAAGSKAGSSAFVLQARRRADAGAVRAGFTVSRQVGNAVERNRVRRRLREIMRLVANANFSKLQAGHDYVLIGRRAALELPFSELMRELDMALSRIHPRERERTGGTLERPLHEVSSPVSRPAKLRQIPPRNPPTHGR
ncbi:MAG: ribonuclease P protein component [Pseudomonadota bacterium]